LELVFLLRKVLTHIEREQFVHVDEWIPEEKDMIFRHTKGSIILPELGSFYGDKNEVLEHFVLTSKRCYNSDEIRIHCCHYMNYFLRYYDQNKELIGVYFKIKYLIDYEPLYNKEAFFHDINMFILRDIIMLKIKRMNEDNYSLSLKYKNNKNPSLQYTDKHALILMEISIIINMLIPLVTHFMYVRKIQKVTDFLLEVFDIVIDLYIDDCDIYSKLYETAISTTNKNRDNNEILWSMQNIRGKNTTTHSLSTVNNILLQIIPKYTYSKNIICFNYESIKKNTGYQITDITYEYSFVSLSSSRRDEDQNSEFDKFESMLTKADESLYLQNKVNCEDTMKYIEMKFGPFSQEEIDFYRRELSKDGKFIINDFQKELVFNLFYKFFGDVQSIKAINSDDYIKLILAAKKILSVSKMVVLPYVVSARINRLVSRKCLNKKEQLKIESSPFYPLLMNKYRNDKIEKNILSIIAMILSSDFYIISYDIPEIHGQKLEIQPEFLLEEILYYVTLI
jgi:hypothetical protein